MCVEWIHGDFHSQLFHHSSQINPPTTFFNSLLFPLSSYLVSMKSTAYLTLIMTVNWIFEIISFYNDTTSTFFDIINALQGVFIFFIFLCLPRPLKMIKHWWRDRGSFQVIVEEKPPRSNDIQLNILRQ